MIEELLSVKGWKLFLGIVFLNVVIAVVSQLTLIDETVFFNSYSEQLTYDRAIELFQEMRSFSWIAYAITFVMLILKFTSVSILIFIGVFFADLQREITLGNVFKVVIISELIFIAASVVKIVWFIFFVSSYTLEDLSFFYPLSLINLFTESEVASYWVYPLQTVNLFQVLYVLMLAYGLGRVGGVRRQSTDKVVLSTYIPGLAIWIAVVMFLTIDVMP
ncbi:MAG: hypothetical protein R2758_00815 [Bacteroidales bacterium]